MPGVASYEQDLDLKRLQCGGSGARLGLATLPSSAARTPEAQGDANDVTGIGVASGCGGIREVLP